MKDKIYKFLQEHGGSAPAIAIAHSVLHLRSGSRAAAVAIVEQMLQQDSQFGTDGMGTWYINSPATMAVPQDPLSALFCLIAAGQDSRRIATATRAALAATLLQQGEISPPAYFEFRFDDRAALESTWEAFREWLPEEAIWVSEAPAKVQQVVQHVALLLERPVPARWEINLIYFAWNTLDLDKRPVMGKLGGELGIDMADEETLEQKVFSQAGIFDALLGRLAQAGSLTQDAFRKLGEKPPAKVPFATYAFTEADIQNAPETPGVYLMRNAGGEVIYVGKAGNLRRRLASYFLHPDLEDRKIRAILHSIKTIDYEQTDTELDARIREVELIQKIRPRANTQIEILSALAPQNPESCRIVIMLSALLQKAIVYLFSSNGRIQRIASSPARPPRKKLTRALAEICFDAAGKAGAGFEKTACELAWRFWKEKRDEINWFDPHEIGNADACLDIILTYVRNPESLTERSIVRPFPKAVR